MSQWQIANDTPVWLKPRRTVYFLTRTVAGKRDDCKDKRGRLRTWSSWEKAARVRDRLNGELC